MYMPYRNHSTRKAHALVGSCLANVSSTTTTNITTSLTITTTTAASSSTNTATSSTKLLQYSLQDVACVRLFDTWTVWLQVTCVHDFDSKRHASSTLALPSRFCPSRSSLRRRIFSCRSAFCACRCMSSAVISQPSIGAKCTKMLAKLSPLKGFGRP